MAKRKSADQRIKVIIDHIDHRGSATITELAGLTGWKRELVAHYVRVAEDHGLLIVDPSQRGHKGSAVFVLG